MIVNWNKHIKDSRTSDALIDFTDFYTTFEDILDIENPDSYGKSLLPLILNDGYKQRDVLITYYNPMWGTRVLDRGVYAQNKTYKLYKSGKFFKYSEDLFEENSLLLSKLSEKENEIYNFLKKSLDSVPDLPKENHNGWKERGKQVKQSNKFNLIWQLNTK